MKFLVLTRKIKHDNKIVENYGLSFADALTYRNHEVVTVDKGAILEADWKAKGSYDWIIDIDSGREPNGTHAWLGDRYETRKQRKIAIFIDSHGAPALHTELSQYYDHVFFAVWAKRDLFSNHDSAHWMPNFTDLKWFYPPQDLNKRNPKYDVGFFGSKLGLTRADPLKSICEKKTLSCDIRQVNAKHKHRWPHTNIAMNDCRLLFNHSQKHDGPNLRVMESMACHIPLITDYDPLSGMNELFSPYKHYIPYEAYTYKGLEEAIDFCIDNPDQAKEIAHNAYYEVLENHLVEDRVEQLLEVIGEI